MMIDHTGHVFDRLTVKGRATNAPDGSARWRCECVCGNTTVTFGSNLRRGSAKSCGCLQREMARQTAKMMGSATRVHGDCTSPEYRAWSSMIQRCTNRKHRQYRNYGARGIEVCDRWRSDFIAFVSDMGERPSRSHSLDRRDNDGPYSPENCRWATKIEQNNNMRTNRIVSYVGRRMTLADAVRASGRVKYSTAYTRISRDGWSAEAALS